MTGNVAPADEGESARRALEHIATASSLPPAQHLISLMYSGRYFLEAALSYYGRSRCNVSIESNEELRQYIERLGSLPNGLTAVQVRWCQDLRGLGNKAVHPESRKPTSTDAIAALSLARKLAESLGVNAASGAVATLGPAPTPLPSPPISERLTLPAPPPPPTPLPPRLFPNTTPLTHEKVKRALNVPAISAVVAAVFALGWLLQQRLAGGKEPTSPYPIELSPIAASINVRGGPGSTYPTIGTATKSERLIVYGTALAADGGTWDYVKLGDGAFGYVNSRVVAAADPQEPQPPVKVAQIAPDAASPAQTEQDVDNNAVPSSSASPTDDGVRVRQVITSTNFYRDESPGSGQIAGQSIVFRVDGAYADARPGDIIEGAMVQNGQVVGRCGPIRLQTRGNFWCRIAITAPGNYQFVVGVNGVPVTGHEFNVNSPAQAANDAQLSRGRQSVSGREITDQLIGAIGAAALRSLERNRHDRN